MAKRKMDIYEKTKRKMHHNNLDNDKKVQKQYKAYNKLTGNAKKWSKEEWYDLNYPAGKSKPRTKYLRTKGKK